MLRASLQSSGYEVALAQNGAEALQAAQEHAPDLVITDLAMPEMDGVELTRRLREQSEVPIIVLSVRDSENMKIRALDAGADDYVTKPFSMPELLARVRAQLRRTREEKQTLRVEAGDFIIDAEGHYVSVQGENIHLTPKEFDLLFFLAKNPDRILTHKVLLREIWGLAGSDQPEYLRVLIAQLRKKISRPGLTYIESEPWVGYRFHPKGRSPLTES
jgi:two-component system, OmpR family, KDP operon response regulator KdpE